MGLAPHPHFLKHAEIELACSDFDAEHPVWLYLNSQLQLPFRRSIWLSLLYMAFYDEGSAWAVFNQTDPYAIPSHVNYPIGTNRRNLFGSRIIRHFAALRVEAKKAAQWPIHNFIGEPERDWDILRENLGQVWGNGRFGIYTTAEMLHKVNKLPVTITGFDNDGSSGPADGVRRVYKCSSTLEDLDKYTEEAYQLLSSSPYHCQYSTIDRGITESVLCTFGATCRGRYYPGRNIDRQEGRIARVEQMGDNMDMLWEARSKVFRSETLGENNGWSGIDKKRLKHYKETKVLLWPSEDR